MTREEQNTLSLQFCPGCHAVFPVGGTHRCPGYEFLPIAAPSPAAPVPEPAPRKWPPSADGCICGPADVTEGGDGDPPHDDCPVHGAVPEPAPAATGARVTVCPVHGEPLHQVWRCDKCPGMGVAAAPAAPPPAAPAPSQEKP